MRKLFSVTMLPVFFALTASAQLKTLREIWLFTPDAGNASFIRQKSALTDAAGLKERDIQVHEIVGYDKNQALFKKYKASAQKFTFILVGKDGGVKLRSDELVSREKLYRTIDAMPMRKSEMNRQP